MARPWLKAREVHDIRIWLLSTATQHLLATHVAVLRSASARTVRTRPLPVLWVAPRPSTAGLPVLDGFVELTIHLGRVPVAVVAHTLHDFEPWVTHFFFDSACSAASSAATSASALLDSCLATL